MAKKKEEVVTKKKVGRPKKVAEEKLETKNGDAAVVAPIEEEAVVAPIEEEETASEVKEEEVQEETIAEVEEPIAEEVE